MPEPFAASACPVPEQQQPLNEYERLKAAWLFRWATFSRVRYARKLLGSACCGTLLASPLVAASFPPATAPGQFLLGSAAGGEVLVLLLVVRLYLGWSYVRIRLSKARVPYEETGWYDGQTWQKPPETVARDRLVVTYQIAPILSRLQATFAILALLLGAGTLAWLLSFGD
jgi:hypothetical protein